MWSYPQSRGEFSFWHLRAEAVFIHTVDAWQRSKPFSLHVRAFGGLRERGKGKILKILYHTFMKHDCSGEQSSEVEEEPSICYVNWHQAHTSKYTQWSNVVKYIHSRTVLEQHLKVLLQSLFHFCFFITLLQLINTYLHLIIHKI